MGSVELIVFSLLSRFDTSDISDCEQQNMVDVSVHIVLSAVFS